MTNMFRDNLYDDFLDPNIRIEELSSRLDNGDKALVNILNYRKPNESEYTQALYRAFADLPRGGIIEFPAAECIVNDVEIPSNVFIKGQGREATQIKRDKDNPVFKITGTPLPNGGMPSHWNNGFQDVTIGSNGTFNTDLTRFQGVTGMTFYRMRFYAYECRLMYTNQMWDSRIDSVQFFNGGRDDGTPALELASGFDGYRMTKETVVSNCHFETYKGSAIRTARDTNTIFKTHMMTFANLKFESTVCTKNHLNLEINTSLFNNVYISHQYTTTDVVMFKNSRGIQGNLALYYIGSNVPASLVHLDSLCYLVDLRIMVGETQPSNGNVVTQDKMDEPTINLNISAKYPIVNGVTTNMTRIGQASLWFDSKNRPRISAGKTTGVDTGGYFITRQMGGGTQNRPTGLDASDVGYPFFDTTLNKPIWWSGTSWRDSAGTQV